MKIAVLHVFIAMATGWSATVGTGQTCERISNKMCQGLGYNYTMFPNSVNHKSQNEATLQIHKYYPLILYGCSKYLRMFVCSVYMPVCSRIPIPPCRLLCEETKKGCEPFMKTFGFPWPKEFDCGIFANLGDRLCISAPGSLSTTPHASVCEEISVPMCKGIGYNYTKLPNMLNHTTQSEVALEIHQFFPLVEVKCSSYLRQFLCSVYTPQCTQSGTTIPPCRSLCEESRRGCEPLMKKYGFTWTANLKCSKFPVKGSGVICNSFDLQSDIKPTTKAPKVSPLTEFRKILTKVRGVLTSPNYPNTYPLGIKYEWTIQLPDSYNLIKITIEKMRLEEDKNCFYDYVMIKDKMLNQVGRRHCGTYRSPYEISVRGNKAIIIFVSDATTSKAGFSIKYRGLVSQADS